MATIKERLSFIIEKILRRSEEISYIVSLQKSIT